MREDAGGKARRGEIRSAALPFLRRPCAVDLNTNILQEEPGEQSARLNCIPAGTSRRVLAMQAAKSCSFGAEPVGEPGISEKA